jgi:hypothetical protein
MATKQIDFTVVPSAGITGFWIAVGSEDVPLVDGKGSIDVESGTRPGLTWWMTGNPRASISIAGVDGTNTVVAIKGSKIPEGETEGGGFRRFEV